MNTESTQQSVRASWQDRQVWVAWLCVAGQLLTTHALIKLALLALAAVLLVSHVQRRGFLLPRSSMMLGGAVLFGVCYLACPYWTLTTLPEGVGPSVTLLGLLMVGALWCWCFAQPVEQTPNGSSPLPIALFCVAAVLALVGAGLFAPLEWRGDEDTHLARLWALADCWLTMPLGWAMPLGVVLCWAALWNPGRRISLSLRTVMVFGSLAIVTWSMGQANDVGQLDYTLRRYPAGLLWLQAAATFSVRGWTQALTSGPELARLLPLLSLVGMVLWWTTRCRSEDLASRRFGVFGDVLPALALTTVPVLQCYGTGIYLELPLMLLMLWVCGDAHRLFGDHLRGNALRASWLALALIPFIKETALVFCLAVMAFAALLALSIGSEGSVAWRALALRYLRLGVVVLLPVGVYLYFRMQGPEVQFPYHFYPPNFVEPTLYRMVAQALWQQYGLLLVLAAVGLACTLRHRPGQAVFCVIVLIGYFLFFSGGALRRVRVDGVSLPGYLGHARFMLYLLPPLLTLAWNAVLMLGKSRPVLLSGVMAICLAGNLWMSPLRADGTRLAGWGDTLIDTQGHHYPYPQLYAWFADTVGESEETVAIVGRRYAYEIGDKMYARRFNLKLDITAYQVEGTAKLRVGEPLMTLDELATQFTEAALADPDYIVIHQPVWGPKWDDRSTLGRYDLAEAVGRFEHRLIVYRRRDS